MAEFPHDGQDPDHIAKGVPEPLGGPGEVQGDGIILPAADPGGGEGAAWADTPAGLPIQPGQPDAEAALPSTGEPAEEAQRVEDPDAIPGSSIVADAKELPIRFGSGMGEAIRNAREDAGHVDPEVDDTEQLATEPPVAGQDLVIQQVESHGDDQKKDHADKGDRPEDVVDQPHRAADDSPEDNSSSERAARSSAADDSGEGVKPSPEVMQHARTQQLFGWGEVEVPSIEVPDGVKKRIAEHGTVRGVAQTVNNEDRTVVARAQSVAARPGARVDLETYDARGAITSPAGEAMTIHGFDPRTGRNLVRLETDERGMPMRLLGYRHNIGATGRYIGLVDEVVLPDIDGQDFAYFETVLGYTHEGYLQLVQETSKTGSAVDETLYENTYDNNGNLLGTVISQAVSINAATGERNFGVIGANVFERLPNGGRREIAYGVSEGVLIPIRVRQQEPGKHMVEYESRFEPEVLPYYLNDRATREVPLLRRASSRMNGRESIAVTGWIPVAQAQDLVAHQMSEEVVAFPPDLESIAHIMRYEPAETLNHIDGLESVEEVVDFVNRLRTRDIVVIREQQYDRSAWERIVVKAQAAPRGDVISDAKRVAMMLALHPASFREGVRAPGLAERAKDMGRRDDLLELFGLTTDDLELVRFHSLGFSEESKLLLTYLTSYRRLPGTKSAEQKRGGGAATAG